MTIASCTAQVLHADKAVLERLRAGPVIEFIDHRDEQREELRSLRPPPDAALVAEPCRWAYYPWRRTVTAVLGPRAFRAVRLDRNRNLITAEEQTRLGALRIGVAGLSVGHVIAHTLAAQGICGELRLADFDRIELSNLNRVPLPLPWCCDLLSATRLRCGAIAISTVSGLFSADTRLP
jgi:ThiF family